MGWKSTAKQKVDWHRAELTPNDARRQAKRDAYDKKYDKCSHGTHPASQCNGRDG